MAIDEYADADPRNISQAKDFDSVRASSDTGLNSYNRAPAGYPSLDPIQALAQETGRQLGVEPSGYPAQTLVHSASTPAKLDTDERGVEFQATEPRPTAPLPPYGTPVETLGYGQPGSQEPAGALTPDRLGQPVGLYSSAGLLERHQIYQDGESSDTLYQIVDQGNEAPVILPIASGTVPFNAGQVVSTSYSNLTLLSQPAYANPTYSVADSQTTGQAAEPYGASPYNGYGPYSAGGNGDAGYPSQGNGGVISSAQAGDALPASPAKPRPSLADENDKGEIFTESEPQAIWPITESAVEPTSPDDALSLFAQNTLDSAIDPQTSNTTSDTTGGYSPVASDNDNGFDNSTVGIGGTESTRPPITQPDPSTSSPENNGATTSSESGALASGIENQLIEAIAGYITHAVEGYLGGALSSQLPALLAEIVPGL